MGSTGYKLKNMFKSKEQIELEARMQFNQTKRSFARYYQDLDGSIKNFSRMARDAELNGNHENAKAAAKFVLKLQSTQVRVQGLLHRFEMMHSMQELSGVMSKFMRTCADMGYNIDANIDLKGMMKDTLTMGKALNKLDAMTEQMDLVFDTIDDGMRDGNASYQSAEEQEEDAERMLDSIMGRHNAVSYPTAVGTAAVGAPAAEPKQAETDDTDERLRKMLQELKE